MISDVVKGIKHWPSDADFFETSEIAATAPFPGKYGFLQPCHSASLIIICMCAFRQPISICLFAKSNEAYLFAVSVLFSFIK